MYRVVADGTEQMFDKIGHAEEAFFLAVFVKSASRVEMWHDWRLVEVTEGGKTEHYW